MNKGIKLLPTKPHLTLIILSIQSNRAFRKNNQTHQNLSFNNLCNIRSLKTRWLCFVESYLLTQDNFQAFILGMLGLLCMPYLGGTLNPPTPLLQSKFIKDLQADYFSHLWRKKSIKNPTLIYKKYFYITTRQADLCNTFFTLLIFSSL